MLPLLNERSLVIAGASAARWKQWFRQYLSHSNKGHIQKHSHSNRHLLVIDIHPPLVDIHIYLLLTPTRLPLTPTRLLLTLIHLLLATTGLLLTTTCLLLTPTCLLLTPTGLLLTPTCLLLTRWYFLLKSCGQHGSRKNLQEDRAAMTGIQGVSSSLWLPMSQSEAGNSCESEGTTDSSCNNQNMKQTPLFTNMITFCYFSKALFKAFFKIVL